MKNSISPQKKEHSIRYALEHADRPLKALAQELGVLVTPRCKNGSGKPVGMVLLVRPANSVLSNRK